MSKIQSIDTADQDAQETAGMLNKNWHQILKAAMLKMGVTQVDLPFSDLEFALDHGTHLSIQVSKSGFNIQLLTVAEAEALAKDVNTDVIETDTSFQHEPKQHLNS